MGLPDPDELRKERAAIEPAGDAAGQEFQARLDALLELEGVEGFGWMGEDEAVVYVRSESVRPRIPARIDGLRLRCEVTGSISARS